MFGAPGETRTPDQVVRSHLLYPTELRVHGRFSWAEEAHIISGAGIKASAE